MHKAKRRVLLSFKKFIRNFKAGRVNLPIAIEAINYLQQLKHERQNFKWIKNKEQERLLNFVRRTQKSMWSGSGGHSSIVEENFEYVLNQLYRDKDFTMLTVAEMETMELEYYLSGGKMPNYDLIAQQVEMDHHLTDLKHKYPELFVKLQNPSLSPTDKLQAMQIKIQDLKDSSGASQDEIELLMLQKATFEVQNRLNVVRSMQQKLDKVNKVINS